MRSDDELAHIEDTLRSESFIFGVEHIAEECTCKGKQCTRCQEIRCVGSFYHHKLCKDGLNTQCKI